MGKGLGVVATDINNDGRMDLFVANDTVQDFSFCESPLLVAICPTAYNALCSPLPRITL